MPGTKESELIERLREAKEAVEKWPESMKMMHEMRQRAEAYFAAQENSAPTAGAEKLEEGRR